jgi:hypothetical protein
MGLSVAFCLSFSMATEPNTGKATAQWTTQLQQGRFHIHADFAIAQDEGWLTELAALSANVSKTLQLKDTSHPIHVVLFSNAKEYRRYIKNYFPNVPERRALFIQGRGPGMLFAHWHEDIHTDIRHEVVHGLLNDHSNPLPLWLDEGLAEYFEVEESKLIAGNPHLIDVCKGLESGYVPMLEDLEVITSIEQLGSAQYRDSWAWVHFMLHRNPQTRQHLVKQLAECRGNKPVVPLSRIVAQEVPNWRAEFTTHFRALAAPTQPAGVQPAMQQVNVIQASSTLSPAIR